jgi:hypothetical protein
MIEREELWSCFLIVRFALVFLFTPVALTGFFIAIVLTNVLISAILGGLANYLGFYIFSLAVFVGCLTSRMRSVIMLCGRYCRLDGVRDGRDECWGRVREMVAEGSNSSSIFKFGLYGSMN